MSNENKMQCKVKIGSAYEPKWFEHRHTQGTYSGKNVPLDKDGMWLQDALLGYRATRHWKKRIAISIICSCVLVAYFKSLGVL